MNARESMLSRLPKPSQDPPPEPFQLPSGDLSRVQLWSQFHTRFSDLGGTIVTWQTLAGLSDRNWIVEPGLDVGQGGMHVDCDVWNASVGVTRADLAVAETGSLLLNQWPFSRRMASLAPPIHVAVINESSIVPTLDAAIERLERTNAVLVTGPSRTADIEGVLVRGVHGPGELWLIVERD